MTKKELLINEIDKEYLDSTTIVTKDNLDELEWEIAIYKDLLSGSLDISGFSIENIDSKINSIFPNIKTECKEVIKKALIKRIKDINKS